MRKRKAELNQFEIHSGGKGSHEHPGARCPAAVALQPQVLVKV